MAEKGEIDKFMDKDFKKNKKKFCLVYRWNYELSDCSDKFFKDIQRLFFPSDEMTEKRRANNIFVELFLNGESCGYCVTLNNADSLKKFSHLLSDVDKMIFDEFQSENNHYCPNDAYLISRSEMSRNGMMSVKCNAKRPR